MLTSQLITMAFKLILKKWTLRNPKEIISFSIALSGEITNNPPSGVLWSLVKGLWRNLVRPNQLWKNKNKTKLQD